VNCAGERSSQAQNAVGERPKGDVLGHVFDRGYAEYRGRSDIRGYQTRADLEFHTEEPGASGCGRCTKSAARIQKRSSRRSVTPTA